MKYRFEIFLRNIPGQISILKVLVSISLILTSILFMILTRFKTIGSIIAGAGVALFISYIFEYFRKKEEIWREQEQFKNNLSLEIQRYWWEPSRELKSIILNKLFLLRTQFPPSFFPSGSIEKLEFISYLFDNTNLTKKDDFLISPLIEIIFSGAEEISGKIVKQHKRNISKMVQEIDVRICFTLKKLYYNFYGDYGPATAEFIKKLNKSLEKRLKNGVNYHSAEQFIQLYECLCLRSIGSNALHKGKLHYIQEDVTFVYYGFYEGINLSIKGLKMLQKIFPDKKDVIENKIKELKEDYMEIEKIEKFKLTKI